MQSKSINVNFGHFSAKYQGYSLNFWPKQGTISSLFNVQSKSINVNLVISRQNTKVIALLFRQPWLIFITFHCAVKIKAKYQGYSLTFWPNMAHFHHFSLCSQNQSMSILVIFLQNTKVIALLFGQIWLIFITFHCAVKINQCQFWSFFCKIPRL